MKHLGDVVVTYDFDRRIKTLKGLTLCGPLQSMAETARQLLSKPAPLNSAAKYLAALERGMQASGQPRPYLHDSLLRRSDHALGGADDRSHLDAQSCTTVQISVHLYHYYFPASRSRRQ